MPIQFDHHWRNFQFQIAVHRTFCVVPLVSVTTLSFVVKAALSPFSIHIIPSHIETPYENMVDFTGGSTTPSPVLYSCNIAYSLALSIGLSACSGIGIQFP